MSTWSALNPTRWHYIYLKAAMAAQDKNICKRLNITITYTIFFHRRGSGWRVTHRFGVVASSDGFPRDGLGRRQPRRWPAAVPHRGAAVPRPWPHQPHAEPVPAARRSQQQHLKKKMRSHGLIWTEEMKIVLAVKNLMSVNASDSKEVRRRANSLKGASRRELKWGGSSCGNINYWIYILKEK